MRLLLFLLFWFLYFPLLKILTLVLSVNSKIASRIRFEKKNKFEARAQSFKDYNIVADICFEVSSEGEFQQVAPLIDDLLGAGKKVELVFFSPSVEKTIMKLGARYPEQLRYFRYPLLRLFPFIERRSFTHWVTAKTLVMVRYDLFPEFLLWGMKKGNKLRLVWFTFKKERSRNKKPSFWKKLFLKFADVVVYSGEKDSEVGESLNFPGHFFDFRVEQIRRRILKKEEKFKELFPLYHEFSSHLSLYKKDQKLILGNAWPSDLFLLKSIPKDTLVVIVPHNLNEEVMALFREYLDLMGREYFELNEHSEEFRAANTLLINKKGILCELYSDFDFAYVGGGFEGSIHSVLEPLISGSLRISCGPFHHRSTEYDIAEEWGRISEVNTPEQFLSWLNEPKIQEDRDKIASLVSDYAQFREFVASC